MSGSYVTYCWINLSWYLPSSDLKSAWYLQETWQLLESGVLLANFTEVSFLQNLQTI